MTVPPPPITFMVRNGRPRRKDGTVHELDLAWSRDQTEKVYVQHKMTERGSELWKWLQDGAVFYVCGDASRMAKDADQALRDIASKEGGMGEDEAAAWIKALQKEKRYLKDALLIHWTFQTASFKPSMVYNPALRVFNVFSDRPDTF